MFFVVVVVVVFPQQDRAYNSVRIYTVIKFFPNGSYRLSIKFLAVGMFLKGSPGIKTCMGGGGGGRLFL